MLNSILKSPLARNAAWMFVGQGLRLVLQAFYFIEIARCLGVSNYGAFVGVVSLVGIFYPFGALGSGNLLVQNVAREPDQFRKYWGNALATTVTSSSVLLVVVLLVSFVALPRSIPILLVFLVAASDLFGLNMITLSGQAFQVREQLNWTATLNVMVGVFRVAGALALAVIYTHPSALQWGYFYCGSTALSVAVAVLLVSRKLGAPILQWRRSVRDLREGFYFSAGLSSQTIYNDIDKTMLARMGTLAATGIYGAAYRIIERQLFTRLCIAGRHLSQFFSPRRAGNFLEPQLRGLAAAARFGLYRAGVYLPAAGCWNYSAHSRSGVRPSRRSFALALGPAYAQGRALFLVRRAHRCRPSTGAHRNSSRRGHFQCAAQLVVDPRLLLARSRMVQHRFGRTAGVQRRRGRIYSAAPVAKCAEQANRKCRIGLNVFSILAPRNRLRLNVVIRSSHGDLNYEYFS